MGDVGHKRFACPHKQQVATGPEDQVVGTATNAAADSATGVVVGAPVGHSAADGPPVSAVVDPSTPSAVAETGTPHHDRILERNGQSQPGSQQVSVVVKNLSSPKLSDTEQVTICTKF